jgi:hypothetical protein
VKHVDEKNGSQAYETKIFIQELREKRLEKEGDE